MSKSTTAGDIMTNEVIVANTKNKFQQVMQFFSRYKIQHLPVVENDKIIGIVSLNDILEVLYNHLSLGDMVSFDKMDSDFDIKTIMTSDPFVIDPEMPIEEVLRILASGEFQSLPVAKNGIIKGIITNKDLVRAFNDEKNPPHSDYSIETPGFGI